MRLPEIALELRQLSVAHNVPRLAELAAYIRRRKPVRKSAQVSIPLSDDLIEQVRRFANDNPEAAQVEIAQTFNINQGRVSEILHGKRK